VIGSFICGVIFYKIREGIRLNFVYFLFSVLATWVMLLFEATELLGVVPLTYVTVYIGMLNPKIGVLKSLSNYSYGIYLYGFPIQQAIYTAFPFGRSPLINFVSSCLLATLVAAVSWHFVESGILKNRGQIKLALVAILDRWEKGLSRGKTS
jgi:peptidoglycan/LPS O-acetylase OafA/YrhL